jgi:hypothetical protein
MNDRIRNNGARTGPAQGTQMIKGLSGRSMSGNEFVLELQQVLANPALAYASLSEGWITTFFFRTHSTYSS